MAKAVNSVLTQCYRDIYAEGPDEDVGQLQLLTSPLAATEEVAKLFEVGLVPVELAMPAVLHAIGATKDDIDKAVDKAKEMAKEKEECERCEKDDEHNDRMMNVKEREAGIKKTEADIKKIQHDANAPYPSASSGGSSRDGSSSSDGSKK